MADKEKKARKKLTPDNPENNSSVTPATMRSNMSDLIGTRLKLYYDEVAEQPVPDRFLKLLDELENKSKREREN